MNSEDSKKLLQLLKTILVQIRELRLSSVKNSMFGVKKLSQTKDELETYLKKWVFFFLISPFLFLKKTRGHELK